MNEEILKEQEIINAKLAKLFEDNGVTNFRLTSIGNSIASGYSMTRTIKPLLERDESLKEKMISSGIMLDTHSFARAQNNNDEHIFEWLVTNTKESEIRKMNRNDYNGGKTSMPNKGITDSDISRYYSPPEKDIGMRDALLEDSSSLANIAIYNGCTGSFLDNITREGKISEKATYGIKRDLTSLEATLKFIQANNRENHTNTQIYICGAPNFLGIGISNIINNKLKSICQKYANTVYIEPIKSKFFYKTIDVRDDLSPNDATELMHKELAKPDIHYDEKEYLRLNSNITSSINENFLVTKSMISLDRNLYAFSKTLELEEQDHIKDHEYISKKMEELLNRELESLPNPETRKYFILKAKAYFLSRSPYDFYYIGKENINNVLTEDNKTK